VPPAARLSDEALFEALGEASRAVEAVRWARISEGYVDAPEGGEPGQGWLDAQPLWDDVGLTGETPSFFGVAPGLCQDDDDFQVWPGSFGGGGTGGTGGAAGGGPFFGSPFSGTPDWGRLIYSDFFSSFYQLRLVQLHHLSPQFFGADAILIALPLASFSDVCS
jgi:hypothetical protein